MGWGDYRDDQIDARFDALNQRIEQLIEENARLKARANQLEPKRWRVTASVQGPMLFDVGLVRAHSEEEAEIFARRDYGSITDVVALVNGDARAEFTVDFHVELLEEGGTDGK